MKKLMGILMLCISTHAVAMTLGGVTLGNTAHVDKSELVLNGAGVRTKAIFNIYVAALYVEKKKTSAAALLADTGAKRIELHVLYRLTAGEFMEAFNKAINANHTPEEYSKVAAQLIHFSRAFREVGEVNKGSVILIDYIPGVGTVLTVNGKERERVAGADFYRAMMKIWLGQNPVQESVKRGLLGG